MIDFLQINGKTGLTPQKPPWWSPSSLAREKLVKRQSGLLCRMETSAFASIIWAFIVLFIATQPSPHDRRFRFLAAFGSFSHSRPAPGALREDAMIVSVTRDGRYFFGGSIIMPEELPGLINSGLKGGAEHKVYLSVDGGVKYWDLSVALEQIKLSGLQDVCFLVH